MCLKAHCNDLEHKGETSELQIGEQTKLLQQLEQKDIEIKILTEDRRY